ncbi:hypothetical protein V6000_010068 [Aspergillus fumigatus]
MTCQHSNYEVIQKQEPFVVAFAPPHPQRAKNAFLTEPFPSFPNFKSAAIEHQATNIVTQLTPPVIWICLRQGATRVRQIPVLCRSGPLSLRPRDRRVSEAARKRPIRRRPRSRPRRPN